MHNHAPRQHSFIKTSRLQYFTTLKRLTIGLRIDTKKSARCRAGQKKCELKKHEACSSTPRKSQVY